MNWTYCVDGEGEDTIMVGKHLGYQPFEKLKKKCRRIMSEKRIVRTENWLTIVSNCRLWY
jgi:hypothetical protein